MHDRLPFASSHNMVRKSILVLYDQPRAKTLLERTLGKIPDWKVTLTPLSGSRDPGNGARPDLIILQSPNGRRPQLPLLDRLHARSNGSPILILPTAFFRKENSEALIETTRNLLAQNLPPVRGGARPILKWQNGHAARTRQTVEKDPLLEDFVERKLKDFVQKIRAGRGRNLYTLLLREIEKPLIRHILRETGGNQVQAATILGINRNTLRKKIKQFRIPVKRSS